MHKGKLTFDELAKMSIDEAIKIISSLTEEEKQRLSETVDHKHMVELGDALDKFESEMNPIFESKGIR